MENDDRGSMYSVDDLLYVHQKAGIPIVFDFRHWRFCPVRGRWGGRERLGVGREWGASPTQWVARCRLEL